MTIAPERVYLRVRSKVDRDETTGCLISRYAVGSHGYPMVGWQENGVRAATLCHLVMWHWTIGPIEKGMTVDHQECSNRRCIEIAHLRLLSNLENARRHNGDDWPLGQCKHGHDDSWWMPKTSTNQKGYCHACHLIKQNARRGGILVTDVTKPREWVRT